MNRDFSWTRAVRRLGGIVLVSAAAALAQQAGISEEQDSLAAAVIEAAVTSTGQPVSAVRADASPRLELLMPVLQKKRTTIMAGSALFFSGCLIQYGLILPKSLSLKPTDLEDQLALISPSLLASGLRYAGTPMSCMRTSEAANAWSQAGGGSPRNLAWKLYFCGWGCTVAAGALNGLGILASTQKRYEKYAPYFATAATGAAISADVVWAATNIYALLFIKRLEAQAAAPRLGLSPSFGAGGQAGLTLDYRF